MPFVKFNIEITLKYGQALYLANSQCDWVIDKMCRINGTQDSLWQLSFDVYQNPFQYKYVIGVYSFQNNNEILWEKGPNRIFNWKDVKSITIKNKWEQRKISFILQADSKTSVAILMSNYNSIQIIVLIASFFILNSYQTQHSQQLKDGELQDHQLFLVHK